MAKAIITSVNEKYAGWQERKGRALQTPCLFQKNNNSQYVAKFRSLYSTLNGWMGP